MAYIKLNQRCVLERASIGKDRYKNTIKTWKVINNNLPCNIQAEIRKTEPTYQQSPIGNSNQNFYVGFFYPDSGVKIGDKITWSGLELYVKIPSPVYGGGNKIHHIEAVLGMDEN